MKEEMEKDERFIIRTYEKAELAHLYNPNMPLVSAMRKLRGYGATASSPTHSPQPERTSATTPTPPGKCHSSWRCWANPETSLFSIKNHHIKLKQFMAQQVKQLTRYLPTLYRQNWNSR